MKLADWDRRDGRRRGFLLGVGLAALIAALVELVLRWLGVPRCS